MKIDEYDQEKIEMIVFDYFKKIGLYDDNINVDDIDDEIKREQAIAIAGKIAKELNKIF